MSDEKYQYILNLFANYYCDNSTKKKIEGVARLIAEDSYDITGFEIQEIPHPDVFCFHKDDDSFFDVIYDEENDTYQFAYIDYDDDEGFGYEFPCSSIEEALCKYTLDEEM